MNNPGSSVGGSAKRKHARPVKGAPAATATDRDLIARLVSARKCVGCVAHVTPVHTSETLDEMLDAQVYLKCENLQRMGAFKFRGAYNMISRIAEPVRRRGVVAFSSGNHAQAVALVSRLLEIPATIVMPSDAPRAKIEATRGYGAEVVHPDERTESREATAARLARERRRTLVPPFDHPDIVAGQGTTMLEMCEQVGPLDVLLVPVGGGGLISGCALAARLMCPGVEVVGVEPEAAADGCESFRTGTLVHRPAGRTIADGARPPALGELTFDVIRRHVTDMITATDAELIDAMRFVWERMKLVVEPTGVLGLAPLLSGRLDVADKRVGVVLSGGNVDLARAGEWFGRA